jgi:hypothetical protein
MMDHELHHRLKRLRTNKDVGVHDQYKFARAFLEGAINPSGKAQIPSIFQKAMGIGEMFDDLLGLVQRIIINDYDLVGNTLDGSINGSDTPGYERF